MNMKRFENRNVVRNGDTTKPSSINYSKILTVVLVTISILLLGSITYSYFSTNATKQEQVGALSTGTMMLRFADNDNGINAELNFGESVTKKFLIENTGTLEASLSLDWKNLVNTYLDRSLTYSLSYSETEAGIYKPIDTDINVPTSQSPIMQSISSELSVPAGKTYYYNLTVTLNRTDVDQSSDVKAIFNTEFDVGQPSKYRYYRLIMRTNGGSWDDGSIQKEELLKHDETLPVAVPTRTGYTFKEWKVQGEGSFVEENVFNMGISDTYLFALWTPNKYTLTIDLDGGEYDGETTKDVYYETPIAIETPTKEGYTFLGWEISGGIVEENKFILTETQNASLKAKWVVNTYKYIAYHNQMNLDGETYTMISADTDEGEAAYGTVVSPNTNVYTGFYTPNVKSLTVGVEDKYPPEKNVINYNYERKKHNVTLNTDGGEISSGYLEKFYETNPPTSAGNNTLTINLQNRVDNDPVDIMLLRYVTIDYTDEGYTYSAFGSSLEKADVDEFLAQLNDPESATELNSTSSIELLAALEECHDIAEVWKGNTDSNGTLTFENLPAGIYIVDSYNSEKYIAVYDENSPAGLQVSKNIDVHEPDVVTGNNTITLKSTDPFLEGKKIALIYAPIDESSDDWTEADYKEVLVRTQPYGISYSELYGGVSFPYLRTIFGGPIISKKIENGTVTFENIPNDGSYFVNLRDSERAVDNLIFITPKIEGTERVYTQEAEIKSYTKSKNFDNQQVYYNDYIKLPSIIVKEGYTFTGYIDENNDPVTTIFRIEDKDYNLTATWEKKKNTLTFNPNGGEVEIQSKIVEYDSPYGELPIPTRDGYIFEGWYTSSNGGSKADANTVMGKYDTTVYAHWSEANVLMAVTTSYNKKMWEHKTNISKVIFENTIQEPSSYTYSYDISSGQNSSVMAYLVPDETDLTKFVAHIQANGNIIANQNSIELFRYFAFKSIEGLEYFDTSNVTDMRWMFSDCSALTTLDLGNNFDTSNVTDMSWMFSGCSALTTLDLGDKFDTSNVTNMHGAFSIGSALTTLNLGDKFDTSNVTDISHMFSGCSSLTTLDLGSNFNTSNVTDISHMFTSCSALTTLDLGNKFDTSNVTDMSWMFSGCSALTTLDLGDKFDTSNVVNMSDMFYNCNVLTTLDLGDKFDTSNVTDMRWMFYNCYVLTTTITIRGTNCTNYSFMFSFAANNAGAQITVNYTADASSKVDDMLATGTYSCNVVKGSVVT